MPERVIRRRNVKSRNRNGCVTCRARRLKCDEGKPECNNDQTQLFNQGSPRRTRSGQKLGAESVTASLQNELEESPNTPEEHTPAQNYLSPYSTPAPNLDSDTAGLQSTVYHLSHQGVSPPTVPLSGSCTPTNWDPRLIPQSSVDASGLITGGNQGSISSIPSPGGLPLPLDTPPAASDHSIDQADRWRSESYPTRDQWFFGINKAPIIPQGLLDSMKFPEDMLYYHHLRDTSPYGVLSVLYLNDILDAEYLNGTFYHAALGLSALKISKSDAESRVRSVAAIHALEHFVVALGGIGKIQIPDADTEVSTPEGTYGPGKREKVVCWLATVLLLAHFELKRGQLRLWCVHGRAAVNFLSSHLSLVLAMRNGESLVRAFSRIAALLEIYHRTHSIQKQAISPEVSSSLVQFLASSTLPYDQLLYIMPRVNALEDEWRANLRLDFQWDERVDTLRNELEQWRENLPPGEIPSFDQEPTANNIQPLQDADANIEPLTLLSSYEPVRAATNFSHYLMSMLRLDMMYSSSKSQRLTATESGAIVRNICRLAIGLPYTLCVSVNDYGHGMLPAVLNAYHLADETMAKWIKGWIASRPNLKEGIWDIDRVQRLIAYLDREYNGLGSRSGWTVIKTRMVEAEENEGENEGDVSPDGQDGQPQSFFVEIYSKGKRGWSVDFVEID
ncbi:c6 zinc finger [Fusarium heterosporum]|uniref:C6 zinc finger n=1 Tax=Fusarium heterosporum TaxID=42747 RepID=A0A8H5T363_FUSHE|nr:c6 zinc finger [Fusarium heterosporum]